MGVFWHDALGQEQGLCECVLYCVDPALQEVNQTQQIKREVESAGSQK